MKRIILSTLVLLLLAACSKPQPQKVEVPKRQGWHPSLPTLIGDVASVTITEYYPIEELGEIAKAFESRTEYKFNKRGDVVEQISYDSDNSVLNRCLYTYNSEHRMTQNAWYKQNGELDWNTQYIYDKHGILVEDIDYNGDGSIRGRSRFGYNSDGKRTEEQSYNGEDILQWRVLLKYNANGNLVEDAAYWTYGELDYRNLYRYDSEGRLFEEFEESCNSPMKRNTYKYDSEGRIIEKRIYTEGEPTALELNYHYDSMGNVVKIAPSTPNSIISEFEVAYRK